MKQKKISLSALKPRSMARHVSVNQQVGYSVVG